MSNNKSRNDDTKAVDVKTERAKRKVRPLTLEELKEVTAGTFTCDSNGGPRVVFNRY